MREEGQLGKKRRDMRGEKGRGKRRGKYRRGGRVRTQEEGRRKEGEKNGDLLKVVQSYLVAVSSDMHTAIKSGWRWVC